MKRKKEKKKERTKRELIHLFINMFMIDIQYNKRIKNYQTNPKNNTYRRKKNNIINKNKK